MTNRRSQRGLTWAAIPLCLTVLASALPAAPTPASPADIAALVEQLGDRSPDVREAAVARLTRIGRPARAALGAAASSDVGPAQRRKLARILLRQLPLADATDAAPLRALLKVYEAAPADARPTVALGWLRARDDNSLAAFGRVVTEESDEDVLWAIVAALGSEDRERVARSPALAGFEPTAAPQMYLVGSAAPDAERMATLFERCLGQTRAVPSAAYTAIARIGNVLAARARGAGDAQAELAARRDVALLVPASANGQLSSAAQTYLETRLRLRNADGLADDLQTLGIAVDQPAVRLVSAILRTPATRPTSAPMAIRAVAGPVWEAVDSMPIDDALGALDVLYRGGELGLVDAITTRMLSQLAGQRDPNVEMRRAQVYMLRYNNARAGNDRAAAGEALKSVLARIPAGATITRRDADGRVMELPVSNLFAEMYVAQVRRAMREDDRPSIESTLDQLAMVSIYDSQLAIDAIYLFEQFGRMEAAEEVYAEYLNEAYVDLESNPDVSSELNGVAWFCARTGRNLNEAYRCATDGTQMTPNNPAMLDTLAEAAFRTGHPQQAVEAERRALAAKRGDKFMTRQLARFTSGANPGDAERPLPSEAWEE